MPIDPTHPKIVEGDEVLSRNLRASEDDVAGHVYIEGADRPTPATEPEGARDGRNDGGAGDGDVEGHRFVMFGEDDPASEAAPESLRVYGYQDDGDEGEGLVYQ